MISLFKKFRFLPLDNNYLLFHSFISIFLNINNSDGKNFATVIYFLITEKEAAAAAKREKVAKALNKKENR